MMTEDETRKGLAARLLQALFRRNVSNAPKGKNAGAALLRKGTPLKPGDCPHFYTVYDDVSLKTDPRPTYRARVVPGHKGLKKCPHPYSAKAAGAYNTRSS